jgi:hypothetical protein
MRHFRMTSRLQKKTRFKPYFATILSFFGEDWIAVLVAREASPKLPLTIIPLIPLQDRALGPRCIDFFAIEFESLAIPTAASCSNVRRD